MTAGIAKKESFPYKIGLKIERQTYKACDSIITLSEILYTYSFPNLSVIINLLGSLS